MEKYALTNEIEKVNGKLVHRIRAVKDFGTVKKGELDGWVESKRNLSQKGLSWISGGAVVMDEALVMENAIVRDRALVCGSAKILGNSCVGGKSVITDCAKIDGHSAVRDYAKIYDLALVVDSEVSGFARVCGKSTVVNHSYVLDDAVLDKYAMIDSSKIGGRARCFGKVKDSVIDKSACIPECGQVENDNDMLFISGIDSRIKSVTFVNGVDNCIHVSCHMFEGKVDNFLVAIDYLYGNDNRSQLVYKMKTAANLAALQIKQCVLEEVM